MLQRSQRPRLWRRHHDRQSSEAASVAGQKILRWDLKENPIFQWLTYYHDAHISAGPPCHWVLAGCHHGRDHWYYRDYLHQLLLLLPPPPPPFPTPPPVSSPLHHGWCCLLDWHETTHRDNFCLSKKLLVKLKYHYIWYKIWEYMAFSPTWLWSPTVGNTATKMDFDLSSKMYLNGEAHVLWHCRQPAHLTEPSLPN